MPRSATVSVGTPGRTLPMSPITIASHRNASGCAGGYVVSAPPPTSSWPSITILIPTGGLPVPRAQRADVGDHVRLGVGGPAAEDRAVALVGHERRRAPQRLVAGGHDVVVRVQQHRRRALGRRDLAGDHRRGVRQLERAEVLHARVAQQLDGQLVRVEDRLARLGVAGRRDRGDRHQPRQVGLQPGHQLRHGFGDRPVGPGRGCEARLLPTDGSARSSPAARVSRGSPAAGDLDSPARVAPWSPPDE